jgi:hypothetical protein
MSIGQLESQLVSLAYLKKNNRHMCDLYSVVPASLTTEFDELLARMQTPAARKGMTDTFNASPSRLGTAAVAVAKSTALASAAPRQTPSS